MTIKYLCLLGHKKYPKLADYNKWQKKIIEKYSLWSFWSIKPEQIEAEIGLMEVKVNLI